MSRPTQSKATNEANAKQLRAMVKQPENKVCADCKRNDPRWASWNLGCFLCIRCSGIHRSMGTHISKVKSIDLDIWTPEQMTSISKWGNKRCNLYWEAHLKPGHQPPDHKVESFIRSKYESRRWAMEGPPPQNPSVLDQESAPSQAAPAPTAVSPTSSRPSRLGAPAVAASAPIDLLSETSSELSSARLTASVTSVNATRVNDSGLGDLSGRSVSSSASTQAAAAGAPTAAVSTQPVTNGGGGGLFDLDWHEPAPAAVSPTSPSGGTASLKGKNDIMSLFSSSAAVPSSATSPRSSARPAAGMGGLNANFDGLSLGTSSTASSSAAANPWAATALPQQGRQNASGGGLFSTQDVWGSTGVASAKPSALGGADPFGDMTSGSSGSTSQVQKKDDAFSDLWGDFK